MIAFKQVVRNPAYWINAVIKMGTEGLEEDDRRRISVLNALSLATAVLATTVGCLFFLFSGAISVLIPSVIEGLYFSGIIYLNYRRSHLLAAVGFILAQHVAVVYFGITLGMLGEQELVILFLVSASMLIFKSWLLRIISILISSLSLIVLEANAYYGIVQPLVVNPHNAFQFHYLAIAGVLFLNVMVITFYVKYNDRYRTRMQNANLSKSIFIRESSHEIRNPLNSIFGISQLLMEANPAEPIGNYKRIIEHQFAACDQVVQVINNIMELSKIEAGKLDDIEMAPFQVRSWISNIISIHQYLANVKETKIMLQIDDNMWPEIVSDKTKLTQIVNNLVMNAIKFTAPHTTITLHLFAENTQWKLQVSDEGEGIPPEKLALIFEPFVSENSPLFRGTGLGLPITKRLTHLLGGTITLVSQEGRGTTFELTFPKVVTKAPKTPASKEIVLNDCSHLKILIVEDDKQNQLMLTTFLTRIGVKQLLLAENGEDGLELVQKETPDVVILDNGLPGSISGKALLEEIKKDPRLKHIPVIIASGDPFNEARDEMLAAGAHTYLVKPVRLKLLHEALSQCVDEQQV
jgi:signal transduction histidine kinase/CheY-like chemotaxis protein